MEHTTCTTFRGEMASGIFNERHEFVGVAGTPRIPRCETCGRTMPEAAAEGRANFGEMTPERRAEFTREQEACRVEFAEAVRAGRVAVWTEAEAEAMAAEFAPEFAAEAAAAA